MSESRLIRELTKPKACEIALGFFNSLSLLRLEAQCASNASEVFLRQ